MPGQGEVKRFAIITMKVPVRADYPWKGGQPDLKDELVEAIVDAIQYKDATQGMARPTITCTVIEEKRDDQGTRRDIMEYGLRDRRAFPTGDRGEPTG